MPHENTPSLKGLIQPDKSCDKQHLYIIREERKKYSAKAYNYTGEIKQNEFSQSRMYTKYDAKL